MRATQVDREKHRPQGSTTLLVDDSRKGKPHTISGPGQSEYYEYHGTFGAPTLVRRTLEGTQYNFNLEYDAEGRLAMLIYPVTTSSYRYRAQYQYDSWGHLTQVRDGNTGALLYALEEADALGREVHVMLGSGVREYRTFDRAAGYVKKIETGPNLLSPTVQKLEFTWDEVGNVTSRANHLISRTESFRYDALNRLTSSQVTGQTAVTVAYSAAGRITSKSDVGSYSYNAGARPYAVTSAGGCNYGYDANGRMTSRCGQALEWYTYDLPKKLAAGTKTAEFSYGVHRDRYKQVQKTGSTTNATIWYVGGLFEVEVAGSTTTYRHHIQARERVFLLVSRVNTTNTLRYLHRDHQESVVEITSSTGSVLERRAFDAWGLRRNATNWTPLSTPFSGTYQTRRGYTGHEHLDTVELIHMNGRVQDPRIGRFISADPIVQAPSHSQSLNRYSYVWNNPVSLVDPSGFQKQIVVPGPSPDCWPGGSCAAPRPLYFGPGHPGLGELQAHHFDRSRQLPQDLGRGSSGGMGALAGELLAPNMMEYLERGAPGTSWNFVSGASKAIYNTLAGLVEVGYTSSAPGALLIVSGHGVSIPRAHIADNELAGAATVDGILLVGGVTAIGRAVVSVTARGTTALARVGERLGTVHDVLRNPSLLAGKGPAEVNMILGRTPGWRVETLGRGAHQGQGWVLREYLPSGEASGRMLRWHPGGGRHGPDPYWLVTQPNVPTVRLPAGGL